jgi:prevent-host-death family protein
MTVRAAVGIRELRQNLSVYLRRVEQGETLEVTERGRPVAVLAPLPGRTSVLDRLIADGHARPAKGSIRDVLPPKPPKQPLRMNLSEALEMLRAEER